jgi:predicted RNase H-like nuclease
LERILKYKKGRLLERRIELEKLRSLIVENLPSFQPSLNLSSFSARLENPFFAKIPSTGAALKAVEDQLDSLICAYVGAHWWYWGRARNLVLGERSTGYIIVPNPAGLKY